MSVIGPLLLSLLVISLASPPLVRAGRRIERHAPPLVTERAARSRQAAMRGFQSARHATVPRIAASAIAQDWQDRRATRRQAAQPAARPAQAAAKASGGATVTDLTTARPRPARTMPPPPAPPKPAGRKPDVTTPGAGTGTGASADLFAALGTLLGFARSGGLHSKRRAMSTTAEALGYMASELATFAKALSEPDQHYPSAVWEPIQRAAGHLQAAASCAADGSNAVGVLIGTTLGEVGARSPHHREMSADG